MVTIVANYATQAFTSVLGGAAYFVEAGAQRDSVTDAAVIALWPANFTTTVPTAASVGQALASYLAVYPKGP